MALADVTAVAQGAIQAADAEIAARCRALGIPEKFRPALTLSWWDRGENADKSRRAELRKVADTQLDAIAKKALTAIERQVVETLTVLIVINRRARRNGAAGMMRREAARTD